MAVRCLRQSSPWHGPPNTTVLVWVLDPAPPCPIPKINRGILHWKFAMARRSDTYVYNTHIYTYHTCVSYAQKTLACSSGEHDMPLYMCYIHVRHMHVRITYY